MKPSSILKIRLCRHPLNQGFKTAIKDFTQLGGWQKAAAVAAGFFGGLASIFILGFGSFAAFRKTIEVLKKGDNPAADRTATASARVFDEPTNVARSSEEPQVPIESTQQQLQRISRSILDNREELWRQAGEDLNRFLILIGEKFSEEERSLSETLADPTIRQLLCSSGRVEAAIKLYELRILSQIVFDKREEFTAQAKQLAGDDALKQAYVLMLLIRGFYQTHGHSLSEALNDRQSLSILRQSARLKLALKIYLKLKIEAQQEVSPEIDDERRERRQQQLVRERAAEHAQGIGLVTQLGMQDAANDPQQLKKQVRQFLLRNHPDRNSQANMDDVRAANEIIQMMKDQHFDLYREEIERLRAQ